MFTFLLVLSGAYLYGALAIKAGVPVYRRPWGLAGEFFSP